MNHFLLRHLIWLGFLLAGIAIHAQEAPVYHPIDKNAWEEATEGVTYQEKSKEVQLEFEEPRQPVGLLNSEFLKIVAFVLIAVILIIIILQLFGKGIFGNKKVAPVITNKTNDLDERPMETDLERYLREALEQNDFRMAIRIYYLMVLRALHDRSLIQWKKEKTNFDYLIELRKHPQYDRLSDTTLLFEYVWYGERPINAKEFTAIKPGFTDLLQQISKPA